MYRIVDTTFWEDPDVIDKYSPEDRYFYLYLLTNPQTEACGIYTLPLRLASFETGYTVDTVKTLLERFENKYQTIRYNFETQEIAIFKFLKYNVVKGGKPLLDAIEKGLKLIKDRSLVTDCYVSMQSFWNDSSRPVDEQVRQLVNRYTHETIHDSNHDTSHESYDESYDDTMHDSANANVENKSFHESTHESYHESYPNGNGNGNGNGNDNGKTHTTGVRATLLADFDKFWKKYPNKIKQEQAASLWLSIDPDKKLVEEIMGGLGRWLASDQWERGIYQSPVNWLRDKRWMDHPPKCKQKKEQAGSHHYQDENLQDLIAQKMAKQRAAKT